MNNRLFLRRPSAARRRGAISVLAAFMSVMVLGMVAFAVDVGYVLSTKQELQRTADAAALAACWDYAKSLSTGASASDAMAAGRATAFTYAHNNVVAGVQPSISQNTGNSASGDLVFGYVADLYATNPSLNTASPSVFNACRLKVRRDATLNGRTPYFFAKIFGLSGQDLDAEATAAFVRNIAGFKASTNGTNLDVLPYALDIETWNALLAGNASDQWTWNPTTKTITSGSDGVKEVNLFPQGTGSPGNRGTIDIGSSNNSTADIARQIVSGISAADLAHHGGKLEFDEHGELALNGDTGISAGVKDELASIAGKPRLIPIFSKVVGPGNNATYTIVHWAGIRIMEVKLTGAMSQKRVIVQPAPMVIPGAIASTSNTSSYAYTPIVLVK
jgi:Flp pilus assembly protein TadG